MSGASYAQPASADLQQFLAAAHSLHRRSACTASSHISIFLAVNKCRKDLLQWAACLAHPFLAGASLVASAGECDALPYQLRV